MSNINSYQQNSQHRFHDHEHSLHNHSHQHASGDENHPKLFCNGDRQDLSNGQNYVSSMCDQDCRRTSCGENDCSPSFNHNPSDNRNCQHVFSGRKCSNASGNRERRRSSNNQRHRCFDYYHCYRPRLHIFSFFLSFHSLEEICDIILYDITSSLCSSFSFLRFSLLIMPI